MNIFEQIIKKGGAVVLGGIVIAGSAVATLPILQKTSYPFKIISLLNQEYDPEGTYGKIQTRKYFDILTLDKYKSKTLNSNLFSFSPKDFLSVGLSNKVFSVDSFKEIHKTGQMIIDISDDGKYLAALENKNWSGIQWFSNLFSNFWLDSPSYEETVLRIINANTKEQVGQTINLSDITGTVSFVKFSPDNKYIFIGSYGYSHRYSARSGKFLDNQKFEDRYPDYVIGDTDYEIELIDEDEYMGYEEKSFYTKITDKNTGEVVTKLPGGDGAFDPSGNYTLLEIILEKDKYQDDVVLKKPKGIKIYKRGTWELIGQIDNDRLVDYAYSKDGKYLITVDMDNNIIVYDGKSLEKIKSIRTEWSFGGIHWYTPLILAPIFFLVWPLYWVLHDLFEYLFWDLYLPRIIDGLNGFKSIELISAPTIASLIGAAAGFVFPITDDQLVSAFGFALGFTSVAHVSKLFTNKDLPRTEVLASSGALYGAGLLMLLTEPASLSLFNIRSSVLAYSTATIGALNGSFIGSLIGSAVDNIWRRK